MLNSVCTIADKIILAQLYDVDVKLGTIR